MPDLLKKEKLGEKPPTPEPEPPKDNKATPEYWAKETGKRPFRGGMRAVGIPLDKLITKKEFDTAWKKHYDRHLRSRGNKQIKVGEK